MPGITEMPKGKYIRSEETKKRMSEAVRKTWKDPLTKMKRIEKMKTHTFSEEHIEKLRTSHMNHVHSKEQCEKMSISIKKVYDDPSKRKERSIISKRQWGDPEIREKMCNAQRGKRLSDEHKRKLSIVNSGENNPGWKGGISFEPYCPMFNTNLKKRIREFFDNRCTCCGRSTQENKRKLSCHPVEYSKSACCDGKPVHFAALCNHHHMITNFDRERWENMLHRAIDEIWNGHSYYTKEEYQMMVIQ